MVAEPAVTVESKPSVNLSTVLTPPVNVAVATLLALAPLVRHIRTPSAASLDVNVALLSTRIAAPRRAVVWLAIVMVPVAVSEPFPSIDIARVEFAGPSPMVVALATPVPERMNPEAKSAAAAPLRGMLTSPTLKVPQWPRNVPLKPELGGTLPRVPEP